MSTLDVIIPVGPGHEEVVHRAMNSVHVARNHTDGPFEDVQIRIVDDTEGEIGRSEARNSAVRDSSADWLFFLDADDMMHPEALENVEPLVCKHDAIWGLTTELVDNMIVTRYQVPTIRTYREVIGFDPYLTIKMGHFARRTAAAACPFNTEMDCGEDWHYYLRMWQKWQCIKVNKPFFIKVRGQHSTGPRSATGRDWNRAVDKLIQQARDECVLQ